MSPRPLLIKPPSSPTLSLIYIKPLLICFSQFVGKIGLSFPRSTILLEYKLCYSCNSAIHTPILSLVASDLEQGLPKINFSFY